MILAKRPCKADGTTVATLPVSVVARRRWGPEGLFARPSPGR